MTERCFLPSRRFCFEARGGLVARRGTGRTAASWISATSRSCASARLRSWVRWFCAMMHQHAVLGQAPAGEPHQPHRHVVRQRRRMPHVEAELHRGRELVDVLPAGPRRAHEAFLEFGLVDADLVGDADHGGATVSPARYFFASTLPSSTAGWSNGSTPSSSRGDDRLQHEMHQQLAEVALVHAFEMDGAHRAAVLRQRLGGGAALRRDQIAHGLAGEIRLAGELGEVGGHARAAPGRRRR